MSKIDALKSKLNSTKNFVQKHKTAIAVVTTASAGVALQLRTCKQYNDFLKEKGLFDEFFALDETDIPVA